MIRARTVSKILGAGFRLGWLCAPKGMLPVFQGFLFGGGVNPFASQVATYFLRDHLADHVGILVEAYRAKRDAMLKGLWEVLGKTGDRPDAARRDRGARAPEVVRQVHERAPRHLSSAPHGAGGRSRRGSCTAWRAES